LAAAAAELEDLVDKTVPVMDPAMAPATNRPPAESKTQNRLELVCVSGGLREKS